MGAQKEDPEGLNYDPMAEDEEGRVREVELDPFFLSKYEMTQEQWKRASGTNPSRYQTTEFFADEIGLHPLDKISWHEATATLSRLGLVLPTEAQWEYAARAGTDWPWSSGPEVDSLVASANVADAAFIKSGYWNGKPGESWNDGVAIHARVGSFRPNGFGLHDVHGNVFEWCRDIYSPYSSEPMPGDGERHAPWPTDKGTMWNHNRVMRGGSYYYPASYARSARRIEVPPENAQGMFGVRPARKLDD
jgi:formylglycine-generating enzyme required for sulfatase activity